MCFIYLLVLSICYEAACETDLRFFCEMISMPERVDLDGCGACVLLWLWIPTFLRNEVADLWPSRSLLCFLSRLLPQWVVSAVVRSVIREISRPHLTKCQNISTVISKKHQTLVLFLTRHLSAAVIPVFFYPLRYHLELTHLHVSAFQSTSRKAPFRPSSLAWILSPERFLLVFGIPGNTSFHEERSVYDDCAAPPTPHSSPFPYITLKAATSAASPVLFLCCLQPTCADAIPSILLWYALNMSVIFRVYIADLLPLWLIPAWNSCSTHTVHIKSLYTLTTWLLTSRILLGLIQPDRSFRRVMFVFSRRAVLKQ